MPGLVKKNSVKILATLFILIALASANVQLVKKFQLSSSRAYFSTVQAGSKLYFIGGYEHSDYVASDVVDVLDLTSDSWSTLNLTTPRGHIAAIVIEERIYMVGGSSYSCLPVAYSKEDNNFTTEGMTSGPTVRRPTRMALHDTTLTVIGAHSIDFMNTTTKQWTHNAQLTSLMSTIFDTTTISHNNFVFLIGGMNMTDNNQSRSVWVVDSPASTPEEFRDKTQPVSSSMFVGSWFDKDHSSVVIRFTNQCLVYHTLTQTWFHRETNNNSITSVSYQNSTIVFFSDGYWTIDWLSMSDTWTSVNQIDFAFVVRDHLVYIEGQQMTVTINGSSSTQQIEIGSIALSTKMEPSKYLLVDSTGYMAIYDADTKQLDPIASSLRFAPVSIFQGNSSEVHVVGALQDVTLKPVFFTVQPDGTFRTLISLLFPDALIGGYFFNFVNGTWAAVDSPDNVSSFGQTFPSAIWTQQGERFYMMQFSSANSPPSAVSEYSAVDVYNWVRSEWEDSIPLPPHPMLDHRFFTLFDKNGVLNVLIRANAYELNPTNDWTKRNFATTADLTHPTFTPTLVIGGVMYFRDTATGLKVLTNRTTSSVPGEIDGVSQQAVGTTTAVVLSIAINGSYSNIITYDIQSNSWRGVQLEPPQSMVSIVSYDGVVLALGDDTTSLSYLNITMDQWTTEPFDNHHVPASMFTLQPMSTYNRTVLVIAGGYHRVSQSYTDEVKFITISATEFSYPHSPAVATSPLPQQSDSSSIIVVAVIVPVVVVAVAAVLLAVLLIKRRQRQRRRRHQSTTIGLEQQFGEWFVPFSDIHFGPQLGQGANGQVFKGKWKNTDVALKVSMTQANQSVISELSLMINMRPHPNVVQLFGFSVHPETNSVILIIEYCNGGSMDIQLMDTSAPEIPISQKLEWLRGIARGVVHLHSNKIVHRDIAARNVLLHQGEPKLTDFGMSRIVDSQQQRGTTKSELGPIRWMSPESLSLKQYSTKSDVWSFGILMFEILAQQEPHVDEDPIEVGRKIRDEGLVPQLPSSLECLSDFTSIMNQCCSVDPNNRASIEQVLQKLEQISL